eukprot:TRINITY_DN1235_c0_g10_i3.p1 TRINITY_DN1235_c0_g10~~TRINITY_DN1235_c0_g10_i3.p1  ORF type:complete len:344 (-),score=107.17 TRINITY_DN1235_c0_g10_i3:168-1199(-)
MPLTFLVNETERVDDEKSGQVYDVYLIKISQPGGNFQKVVKKRFSDFKEFEKGWRKQYPNLEYKLPKSRFFNMGNDVVEERKTGLTTYLNGLATVRALRQTLAEFLKIDVNLFKDESEIKRREDNMDMMLAPPVRVGQRAGAGTNVLSTSPANSSPLASGSHSRSTSSSSSSSSAAAVPLPPANSNSNSATSSGNFVSALSSALRQPTAASASNSSSVSVSVNAAAAAAPAPAPPPPPQPQPQLESALVNYDYAPQTSQEVALTAGETVYIVDRNSDANGWWFAVKADGTQGYIPAAFVSLVPQATAAPAAAPAPSGVSTCGRCGCVPTRAVRFCPQCGSPMS